MKVSKFARFIHNNLRVNGTVGDLARYVQEVNPQLFASEYNEWDKFFNEHEIPEQIMEVYLNMVKMLRSRVGSGKSRPPFAKYMWRYRAYSGPTGDAARFVEQHFAELFFAEYDRWEETLTASKEFDVLEAVKMAYRRSQRNPDDPEYAKYVNRKRRWNETHK
jgi:hypothetical protein